MSRYDETRPFPILGEPGAKRSSIPWWLAEEAYKSYVSKYGNSQSLERIAERGGFGRWEVLQLLRIAPDPAPAALAVPAPASDVKGGG